MQNGSVGNIDVNGNGNGGMLYVKVMTDEQLETLRKQIAVYASICEQLVEMHKNLTAQQDLAGFTLLFLSFFYFNTTFVCILYFSFLFIWVNTTYPSLWDRTWR